MKDEKIPPIIYVVIAMAIGVVALFEIKRKQRNNKRYGE